MHLGKVIVVFGSKPEAIKMAPVINALKAVKDIDTVVIITGQDGDSLDRVLNLFNIVPDYNLGLDDNRDLYSITSGILNSLQTIIAREQPQLILVHGDSTTTFAAALAAFYERIPVGHIEAGLRTRNRYSPYPEEMNRSLTSRLADLHFAPTDFARDNLLSESCAPFKIWVTGNTVIDALMSVVNDQYEFPDDFNEIDFGRRIILLTITRQENGIDRTSYVYNALLKIRDEFEDVEIVFPVADEPHVKEKAVAMMSGQERVHLLAPLEYQPFVQLLNASYMVITDSGGIQEEAPSLGKPVLVLRDETDRPEAVKAGTVRLVGCNQERVYTETRRLLTDKADYLKMSHSINPYGDGRAARRIVRIITDFLYVRIPSQPS